MFVCVWVCVCTVEWCAVTWLPVFALESQYFGRISQYRRSYRSRNGTLSAVTPILCCSVGRCILACPVYRQNEREKKRERKSTRRGKEKLFSFIASNLSRRVVEISSLGENRQKWSDREKEERKTLISGRSTRLSLEEPCLKRTAMAGRARTTNRVQSMGVVDAVLGVSGGRGSTYLWWECCLPHKTRTLWL